MLSYNDCYGLFSYFVRITWATKLDLDGWDAEYNYNCNVPRLMNQMYACCDRFRNAYLPFEINIYNQNQLIHMPRGRYGLGVSLRNLKRYTIRGCAAKRINVVYGINALRRFAYNSYIIECIDGQFRCNFSVIICTGVQKFVHVLWCIKQTQINMFPTFY